MIASGWLKKYTKLKEWQANSCAFEESTPKMKSKGRRKAFSKWTASVCGKTEGLFIKYWSRNQWTIPHTYHTYHTTPTIVLTYKNMPTKIRDSLPIINPDLFVSYVKICRPVQFAFVISRKVAFVSNARNKKILSKFMEVCESDIFLTGQPHCSYHKLVCTVKKFWQRPNYMNIHMHEKHRVAFWPYFCCQSGDHDSRPPLHETSTFEIGQTINMTWSMAKFVDIWRW